MNMTCWTCTCVCDFTRIYWSVKLKHPAQASYHGGGEGNVVNERGGQGRDPHHQDNGYSQALVFWHRLKGEIIRATDNCYFHCHSDAHASPSSLQPVTDLNQTQQLCSFFDTEPLVRERRLRGWSCLTWLQVVVVVVVVSLGFISALCRTHTHTRSEGQFSTCDKHGVVWNLLIVLS